jgi:Xaa-Pro aminopeptidase
VTVEAVLLFPLEGEPVLLVHFENHAPLAKKISRFETRWRGPDGPAAIAEELSRRGYAKGAVGLAGAMPYQTYERLRGLVPEARFTAFDGVFAEMFLVKSAEQLEWFRHAADLTDLAMEALERELRPGLSEHDLAQVVQSAYTARGGRTTIHFMTTTPMRAPDAFAPAQYQSDRVVERGDMLLTEISAQFWGYWGQSLRTYTVGEPTVEVRELHAVAEAAFDACAAAMRVGASPFDVRAAANVIEDAGYSICDDLVHNIGGAYLPIVRTQGTSHEEPTDFGYPEDSLWVIQPNVVTPDMRLGVQVGDLVRVTTTGGERMHHYPMRLVVCGDEASSP